MVHASLVPWLDPETIIHSAGPWALLVVCAIIFAETGLLIGFVLPGDTLLLISGLLSSPEKLFFHVHVYWVALAIAFAAWAGGEVGYLIGRKTGPAIFQREESRLFSRENVERTNAFFNRFGPAAVIVARFVPIVRTFAPIAAGVGKMDYRKYSLYNAIGALAWGAGVVYLGYTLHYIPPVARFVENYIDLILLGAVVVAVVPTGLHLLNAQRKSKRAADAPASTGAEPPAGV
ncbi:DedA family protein [Gryllotalpicola protaetiae]|uniref:DedA family protein n=1 Tax=Gryllotalpicola protaetiae TaxID=2419771 RepID=A0A387BVQ5_9MICO|nr:VTT domain-containing protein [Gryllotalpicola protaetiae]AYG02461.1 DedA family protein [Gryllotalpicola protaetiae]